MCNMYYTIYLWIFNNFFIVSCIETYAMNMCLIFKVCDILLIIINFVYNFTTLYTCRSVKRFTSAFSKTVLVLYLFSMFFFFFFVKTTGSVY